MCLLGCERFYDLSHHSEISDMDRQQQNVTHRWKGFAMEALPTDSVTLKIFCPELTPGAIQGAFKAGITTSPVSNTDINGNQQSYSITSANHITAEYKGESNSAYPPSVAKGEQVWVYQQANSDKFYWDADGRDREKRTVERKRVEISATPNSNETKSDENTYFQEMNSEAGYFTIAKTSKKNGEPYAYYVGVDTKTGRVVISDDKKNKNTVIIDSANDIIQLSNDKGSTFRLDRNDLAVEIKGTAVFKIGGQFIVQCEDTQFSGNVTIAKTMTALTGVIKDALSAASASVSGTITAATVKATTMYAHFVGKMN